MKMMSMKTMLFLGMGLIGYMCLKNNAINMESIKKVGRDTTRKMYNMFEEDD